MWFLLFFLYPLAEIAAFIVVGEAVGVMTTLALVVISSALGFVVLRDAGLMTALRLRRRTANPVATLTEGGSRMAAGLLLLIPGFLTDMAAVAILLPPVRRFLLGRLAQRSRAPGGPDAPSQTIEGNFRRIDR